MMNGGMAAMMGGMGLVWLLVIVVLVTRRRGSWRRTCRDASDLRRRMRQLRAEDDGKLVGIDIGRQQRVELASWIHEIDER